MKNSSYHLVSPSPWFLHASLAALVFTVNTVCWFYNYKNWREYMIKEFYISILLIENMLILVFTVLDAISFYIFFESVLIPMFVLIGVWGSRSQKIQTYVYVVYLVIYLCFILMMYMW